MELADLNVRIIDDARRYDPAAHMRTLLGPHREALLIYRAKFMSYEQVAAALLKQGLKVSPAAVGVFCRKNFTKAEILRERRRLEAQTRKASAAAAPGSGGLSAPAMPMTPSNPPGRRGPKIARDDF